MALGFTSSSSTSATQTSSTSTSSSSATSTSSSSQSTGASFSSKGAEYFFGFLVTFVVLLSLFVCCGLSSRRRLQQRRGLLNGWNQSDSGEWRQSEPPPIYEPRFAKGGSDNLWLSIQPLSASTVSSSLNRPLTRPRTTPPLIRRPSPNPQAIHGLSLPTWMATHSINNPSSNNDILGSEKEPKEHAADSKANAATAMQVAVIIAMPCRPRTRTRTGRVSDRNSDVTETKVNMGDYDQDDPPRYLEIGVIHEVWDSSTRIPKGESS